MDGTGDNHVKRKEPNSERHILHAFSHMWNLDGGYFGERRPVGGQRGMREVKGDEYD
jgi:hypothetical protein